MKRILSVVLTLLVAFSLSAQTKQNTVVMDLKPGAGIDKTMVEGVTAIFLMNFYNPAFVVRDQTQIVSAAVSQGLDPASLTDEQIVAVAQSAGLDEVLVGNLTDDGTNMIVEMRMINVPSAKIRATDKATWAKGTPYRDPVKAMANRMQSHVGKPVPADAVSVVPPVQQQPAPQPAAQQQPAQQEAPAADAPVTLYGFLVVFPQDLGMYNAEPKFVIAGINADCAYGRSDWRLPTMEEMSLMKANAARIPGLTDGEYMTSDGSQTGILRLVASNAVQQQPVQQQPAPQPAQQPVQQQPVAVTPPPAAAPVAVPVAVQTPQPAAPEVSAVPNTGFFNGVLVVNGVEYPMVYVTGGTYNMGNDLFSDQKPVHAVTLNAFYMGKYEVTQALWEAVMGSNPSYNEGKNLPVEKVTWEDCQLFLQKLNALVGQNFKLPTEAQWEFAARGGNFSKGYEYCGSNLSGEIGWNAANSGGETHPVGLMLANELGLHDMSGNVMEWCSDYYGHYPSEPQTNPTGAVSGATRVVRGGCWHNDPMFGKVDYRSQVPQGSRSSNLGFRIVL